MQLTSRRVLTSEWLDGEKLSQSTNDDVGSLVNIGVISYLQQLLEFGFFHSDPHPGNLIRTPDGRLAILDFGLMCEVGRAGVASVSYRLWESCPYVALCTPHMPTWLLLITHPAFLMCDIKLMLVEAEST